MNDNIKNEIERLIAKYSKPDNIDIFRAELEYLVLLVEIGQLLADSKTLGHIAKNGIVYNNKEEI